MRALQASADLKFAVDKRLPRHRSFPRLTGLCAIPTTATTSIGSALATRRPFLCNRLIGPCSDAHSGGRGRATYLHRRFAECLHSANNSRREVRDKDGPGTNQAVLLSSELRS